MSADSVVAVSSTTVVPASSVAGATTKLTNVSYNDEKMQEVRDYIDSLNSNIQRNRWIPMPYKPSELLGASKYVAHPNLNGAVILGVFNNYEFRNYVGISKLKTEDVILINSPDSIVYKSRNPKLYAWREPYATVNKVDLHEAPQQQFRGKVYKSGELFEIYDGKEAKWIQACKGCCKSNKTYAVIDLHGFITIACLETGMIPAEVLLRQGRAYTRKGAFKDATDFFNNNAQACKCIMLCRALDLINNGEWDFTKLAYPDISSIIKRRTSPEEIAKMASGVKIKDKEEKTTKKETLINTLHDIDCFEDRLWLHPCLIDSFLRWCNTTYETGAIITAAELNGIHLKPFEVIQKAVEACISIEKLNVVDNMYVWYDPQTPNRCKMGISCLNVYELRDEVMRTNPSINMCFYRPVLNGAKLEAQIKRERFNDRVTVKQPNGSDRLTSKGELVKSEIYIIPANEMVELIKSRDPEWLRCVKENKTDSYIMIDDRRHNDSITEAVNKASKNKTTVSKVTVLVETPIGAAPPQITINVINPSGAGPVVEVVKQQEAKKEEAGNKQTSTTVTTNVVSSSLPEAVSYSTPVPSLLVPPPSPVAEDKKN